MLAAYLLFAASRSHVSDFDFDREDDLTGAAEERVPHRVRPTSAESMLAVVLFNPRAMLCLALLSVCFCAGFRLCFEIGTGTHGIDPRIRNHP